MKPSMYNFMDLKTKQWGIYLLHLVAKWSHLMQTITKSCLENSTHMCDLRLEMFVNLQIAKFVKLKVHYIFELLKCPILQ